MFIGISAFQSVACHLADILIMARPTESQEAHVVTTHAIELTSFTLNEDGDSINFNSVVNGLSGSFIGFHVHKGREEFNGGVAINLSSNVEDNPILRGTSKSMETKTFSAGLLEDMYKAIDQATVTNAIGVDIYRSLVTSTFELNTMCSKSGINLTTTQRNTTSFTQRLVKK